MNIEITISKDELDEIDLDLLDFHDYIINTLDDRGDIVLPPYNVIIQLTSDDIRVSNETS